MGRTRRFASLGALRRDSCRVRLTVFLAAVVVWWVQAIAMPLAPGRDFGTYVGTFVELFQSDPIDLGYVLGRTPVAPLVTGTP